MKKEYSFLKIFTERLQKSHLQNGKSSNSDIRILHYLTSKMISESVSNPESNPISNTVSNTDSKDSIIIDYEYDRLLSEAGRAILKDRYFQEGEESPQEVFARCCSIFGSNKEHAQRLYDYVSKTWFMFASPILSNAGGKGLPISCFLNSCEDSREGLGKNYYENIFLSSFGGGIGCDFSSIRSMGSPIGSDTGSKQSTSTGLIPFLKCIDSQTMAYQQGHTRRGATAIYLDISHPEIEEFVTLRDHRGTDIHRKCLSEGFHHAVNIPDAFMEAVIKDLDWDLIDPHTNTKTKTVNARELWMKILTKRVETGEPYLHFIDTSNLNLHPALKERGLKIRSSNLCNEIYLPTEPDRTAVCCLSSVNLEFYDEWKDVPTFIPDLLEMLDNVLEYFILCAPDPLYKAVLSAKRERSVGLGAMGFTLYLQKKGIPFESNQALDINESIFKDIRNKADLVSYKLGEERGAFPDFYPDSGKEFWSLPKSDIKKPERFAHKLAIAPNANISVICGSTSPSIEPFNSNIFKQTTLSGSFFIRNKELERVLLEEYDFKNKRDQLEEVWHSIALNQGSCYHLDFMSNYHKALFKTAFEIDQDWIIRHAAWRQKYICQGQSVNLFVSSDIERQKLHELHKKAWDMGLKGLYYCRSKPAISFGTLKQFDPKRPDIKTNILEPHKKQEIIECIGCEG